MTNRVTGNALISNSADLLTFTRAWLNGELISSDQLDRMLDIVPPRVDYGLGVSRYASSTGTVYGHNGRTVGFAASLRHDAERNVTAIVLSNDGNAPTDELADALLDVAPQP